MRCSSTAIDGTRSMQPFRTPRLPPRLHLGTQQEAEKMIIPPVQRFMRQRLHRFHAAQIRPNMRMEGMLGFGPVRWIRLTFREALICWQTGSYFLLSCQSGGPSCAVEQCSCARRCHYVFSPGDCAHEDFFEVCRYDSAPRRVKQLGCQKNLAV